MPLINNLEIRIIFKDKAKEEGVGVTDFIYRTVQVLKIIKVIKLSWDTVHF